MDPEWVVLIIAAGIVLLVGLTTRRTDRDGSSTAAHYDPEAIGGYTLDPATMRSRYDLPTLPRASGAAPGASDPPHRRGRRGRRRTDLEGG